MKSDHWNFLANLLGAPGAAEPPAHNPQTEPAPAAESAKPDARPKSSPATDAKRPAEPARSFDTPTETERSSAGADRSSASQPSKQVVDPLAFTSFRDLDDDLEDSIDDGAEAVSPAKSSQPARQSFDEPLAPPKRASQPASDENLSGEDVLQALTAVTPPPRLPGFGVAHEADAASPRDAGEPAKKETSMWGRIAGKFGVGGKQEREDEPNRAESLRTDDRRPEASAPPRSTTGRSGFGGGLIDLDEDEDDVPAPQAATERDDDDFGQPRRHRGGARGEQDSRGGQPARGGDAAERGRTRRSIAASGTDDDLEALEASPIDGPPQDEPAGRSSRRRGRRGIRQRMSEEDLDRSLDAPAARGGEPRGGESRGGRSHEIRSDESNEREGAARHAGSSRKDGSSREVSSSRESDSAREKTASHRDAEEGRGRGRNRGRGRGRGPDAGQSRDQGTRATQASRHERGAGRHRDDDLPAHDDAFVDDLDSPLELDAEFDDFDDDGFGAGLAGTSRTSAGEAGAEADGEATRSPRSRSRRRGRRGRGRGTAEPTTAATAPTNEFAEDLDCDDDIIDAKFDTKFDDDHEDDEQVEDIRRGSRRRSRSRRSRSSETTAASTDPALAKEEPGRGARDAKSRESQPREFGFSDAEPAEAENSRRRSGVPTWLETVEVLVNANIENHSKAGSKSQRGGRGGNSGGGGRRR